MLVMPRSLGDVTAGAACTGASYELRRLENVVTIWAMARWVRLSGLGTSIEELRLVYMQKRWWSRKVKERR
jgi:hypothetical protein